MSGGWGVSPALAAKTSGRRPSDEEAAWAAGERLTRPASSVALGAIGRVVSRFPAPRRWKVPDRGASILRRRERAYLAPMPAKMAAEFTVSELAVLRIIAEECRAHGSCSLKNGAMAAMAGVSLRTVQNALRRAGAADPLSGRAAPLISVQHRPWRPRLHRSNLVRIIDKGWLAWIANRPGYRAGGGRALNGCKNMRTTQEKGSGREGRAGTTAVNTTASSAAKALRGVVFGGAAASVPAGGGGSESWRWLGPRTGLGLTRRFFCREPEF